MGKRDGLLRVMADLIAIDPGKTNGITAVRVKDRTVAYAETEIDTLLVALDFFAPRIIVIEKWMLYPWMAKKLSFHDFPAPEAIGVVRAWCVRKEVSLNKITASQRSGFDKMVPDDLPKSRHIRDSAAIAAYWLERVLKLSAVTRSWGSWNKVRIYETDLLEWYEEWTADN